MSNVLKYLSCLCFALGFLLLTSMSAKCVDLTPEQLEVASVLDVVDSICTHFNLDEENCVYMYRTAFNDRAQVLKPYYQVVVFETTSDPTFTTGDNNGSPSPDTLYSYDISSSNTRFYFINWYWDVSYNSSTGSNSFSSNGSFYSNRSNRVIVDNQNYYTYTNPVRWYTTFNPSQVSRNDNYVTFEEESPPTSEVSNFTNLDLLSSYYDITFIATSANVVNETTNAHLNHVYPCYLQKVKSDNGYDMLSIQCPSLVSTTDFMNEWYCYYGTFAIKRAKSSNHYDIVDMTLSFAVDIPTYDNENYTVPEDSFFTCEVLDLEQNLSPVSFTVNSLVVTSASGAGYRYHNRVMRAFDFSHTGNSYPIFSFHGVANSCISTSGSFLYNLTYSDLLKDGVSLTQEEVEEEEDKGKKKNDDTKGGSPYVQKIINRYDETLSFDDPHIPDYDFSSLGSVFHLLFNDYLVDLMLACASVGLIGYILFGKTS